MKNMFFTLIMASSASLCALSSGAYLSENAIAEEITSQGQSEWLCSNKEGGMSTFEFEASCPRKEKKCVPGSVGPQGPQGAPGTVGPPGPAGVLSLAYGSVYTQGPYPVQTTPPNEEFPLDSITHASTNISIVNDSKWESGIQSGTGGSLRLEEGDYLVVFGASLSVPDSDPVIPANQARVCLTSGGLLIPGSQINVPAQNQMVTASTIVRVTTPSHLRLINYSSFPTSLEPNTGGDVAGFISVQRLHDPLNPSGI